MNVINWTDKDTRKTRMFWRREIMKKNDVTKLTYQEASVCKRYTDSTVMLLPTVHV